MAEELRGRGTGRWPLSGFLPGSASTDTSEAGTDTSEAGAEHFKQKARTRREWVLDRIQGAGENGLTNAELVDLWGGPKYSTGVQPGIQPRTTELKKLGKIRDSGRRRRSRGGLASIVWIATTEEEESDILQKSQNRPMFRIEPSFAAYQTADKLLVDFSLGGLFRSRDHVARLIQEHAINPAITLHDRMRKQ